MELLQWMVIVNTQSFRCASHSFLLIRSRKVQMRLHPSRFCKFVIRMMQIHCVIALVQMLDKGYVVQ